MKTVEQSYIKELRRKGVVFDHAPSVLVETLENGGIDAFAMDAQPAVQTVSNAGIPAYLLNYLDPRPIRALFSPMRATEIYSEIVKGDWTTLTAQFVALEATGEVAAYGDYNNGGNAGYNTNYPSRESFLYQIITQFGDLEQDIAGAAKLDDTAEKNTASILVLNKFQNASYLYGISGRRCYGILNDPGLYAPVGPGPKAYNSNLAGPWMTNGLPTATPLEVFKDVQKLYAQLVSQSNGLVDMNTPMKLVLSPMSQVALTNSNETFATNSLDLIKKNFPNLSIMAVPEYATDAGNLMQLIVESMDGQVTGQCATNCKLRNGRIIADLSSFKQKKTQGTFGFVLYRPYLVAQMLGI